MPLFNSQGIGIPVELLTVAAIAFGTVGYVGWSSNAGVAEFMSATKSSASDQSSSGPTGCPVGKRKLPTQLRPLP